MLQFTCILSKWHSKYSHTISLHRFASQEINVVFKHVTVVPQGRQQRRLSVTSIPASRNRIPFHFTADLEVKVVWEHRVFFFWLNGFQHTELGMLMNAPEHHYSGASVCWQTDKTVVQQSENSTRALVNHRAGFHWNFLMSFFFVLFWSTSATNNNPRISLSVVSADRVH